MAIFVGTADDNTLLGGLAADILQGYAGNDSLVGGSGQDTLNGGLGDDILLGGLGADRLIGGAGADTIRYLAELDLAGDTILGFAAGDRIDLAATGLGFAPFGYSGAGSEFTIAVDPSDATLWRIRIDRDGDGIGEFGTTVVLAAAAAGGVLAETAPGIVELVLPQVIVGDTGNETLAGGANRDSISGAGGNDSLIGGAGNDSLDGGIGNDTLLGGMGDDTLVGGTGVDRFVWRDPVDLGSDRILDLDATDLIDLSALGNLTFIGTAAFTGNGGEIRFERFGSGANVNVSIAIDIDGDGVQDATIGLPGAKAIEPIATGALVFRLVPDLVIIGDDTFQRLSGRGGDDSIDGRGGADQINGAGGSDTLLGGLGNDAVGGGDGADSIDGGIGADTLTGGAGADILLGGTGNDVFRYLSLSDLTPGSATGEYIADLAIGDRIDLSAIAGLSWIGTGFFGSVAGQVRLDSDFLGLGFDTDGDGGSDLSISFGREALLAPVGPGSLVLSVIGPVDTLLGTGNDTFTGTIAGDTIRGNSGNDSLVGGNGRDSLVGGLGNDTLVGQSGNDTLVGGAGTDTLDGGEGTDRFVFAALNDLGLGATADIIISLAAGDIVDFSLIDWSAAPGDQAFTRISGSAAFSAPGQLRANSNGIFLNTDADGAPEYQVRGVFSVFGEILIL